MTVPAPLPPNETDRLARLRALAVLDTAPEPLFDHLTQLASQICGTPIALVSLIDSDRQWFKSRVGLDAIETHRDLAFCAHAIHSDALMEVPDALLDPRFEANNLVTGEPHIRFYAGAPLSTPEGLHLGTLCVIDRHPRQLSQEQRQKLTQLAQCVTEALLLREKALVSAFRANERVLQEQALRASSLGDILDELPEIISVWGQDGRNQYANTTHTAWFGLPATELHGTPLDAMFPAHVTEQLTEHMPSVLAGTPRLINTWLGRPGSDERRTVLLQMLPLQQAGEQADCFVVLGRDVTAERALKRSEQFLDRQARIAQVGAWELCVPSSQLIWSEQTYRIHDIVPGQPIDLKMALDFYTEESGKTIEAAVKQAMITRDGWDLELQLKTASGRMVWVKTQGEVDVDADVVVRLFGTIQDVTVRRLAQMALEQHKQRLQVTYNATPAMLQSMNAQGQLHSVTDQWLHTLGFARDEVIHRASSDFIHADTRQRYLDEVMPALFASGAVHQVPLRMVGKNGQLREVLMSAVVYDSMEAPEKLALACIDDVTEDLARKAMLARERELRQELERRANELEKLLTERSDMLDVMAHEVRQPLSNAAAALRIAAQDMAADDERGGAPNAQARLARAQEVLSQVQANIDNTLASASLVAGATPVERSDTDIDTLIKVSIGDIPPTHQHRIQIDRASHTRTASMDMNLMRLAVRNLLVNALKYSPPETPVVVRITDSDQPLALALEVSNVCGGGGGISPSLASRLFERGARGPHPQSGHGLGLHIVKRVMDLHQGFVVLTRNTDEGCSFQLLITQNIE